MPDITDTTLAASNAPVAAVAEAAEAADTADIADTTSDITITDAEAEANPEKKENLRELREKAMAQYETIGEDAHRLQRLNSLLEKSAAYVTFVSKKLDTKRAQLRTVEPSAQPPKHSMQSSAAKRMHKAKAKLAIQSEAAAPAADADAEAEVSGAAGQPEEPVGDGRTIDGQKVSPRQPQLITGGIMREYQLEGMEWLASLYENGLNGILADEMGLGKTLQTIAFLCFLRERKVWGPFLILCPLSTLSNWVSEFYRFTPNTPVLLYHGNPDERKELRRKHLRKLDQNFPIVVTTYEISMRDKQALQKFAWKFIIIDEGHRIKNMNCKLIRDLKSYQSTNRLLLTGTPLQNSLSELWSLLNFLLPDIFDDLESFQAWFDFNDISEKEGQDRIISQQTSSNIVTKLHQILQPFLLRRLKADVEKHLPPKREYLIACPMAPVQYEYYQAVRGPNLRSFLQDRFAGVQAESPEGTLVPGTPASLEEPAEPAAVAAAATLAKRKKAAWTMNGKLVEEANAFLGAASSDGGSLAKAGKRGNGRKRPAYAEADENDAFSGDELDEPAHPPKDTMAKASSSGSGLSKLKADVLVRQLNLQFRLMQQRKVCQHPYLFDFPVTDPQDPESEFLIDEQLVRSSGKLLLLDRLLPELFANGHRVLIFSQFARVLDILEFYAELRSWKFCRIDGSVAQTDRQDAIVRFNTDPSIPLFFLTTRSGGLGINLTAADTVVIFDSDWNPQQDLQAQDRVHRIGQKRPVLIYRLIIAGSCERAILKRAKAKRKLEKLVIHDKKFKGLGSNNNNGGGASGGLKDDLSVQDIAQILLDDDTELVEKDQRELKRILESLGPDEQVPEEAILTREELLALTDRSSEAYLKKDDMGSGRIAEVVHVPDGRNDMLSKMETLI